MDRKSYREAVLFKNAYVRQDRAPGWEQIPGY